MLHSYAFTKQARAAWVSKESGVSVGFSVDEGHVREEQWIWSAGPILQVVLGDDAWAILSLPYPTTSSNYLTYMFQSFRLSYTYRLDQPWAIMSELCFHASIHPRHLLYLFPNLFFASHTRRVAV